MRFTVEYEGGTHSWVVRDRRRTDHVVARHERREDAERQAWWEEVRRAKPSNDR